LNSNYLFVAKIEDKIIGCATLHLQQKLIRDGGIAGFIEDVVVSEEFRGLKIGEKLIKRLVEKSKELKCYKVTLSCFTERIDFYKRCGFFVENSTMRHNLQQ
jgi:GNAT superfamily N-acetyltransferase